MTNKFGRTVNTAASKMQHLEIAEKNVKENTQCIPIGHLHLQAASSIETLKNSFCAYNGGACCVHMYIITSRLFLK